MLSFNVRRLHLKRNEGKCCNTIILIAVTKTIDLRSVDVVPTCNHCLTATAYLYLE